MPLKFGNTSNQSNNVPIDSKVSKEWLSTIIYGDPGAGKTYLMSTANHHPETGRIILLDVEGGKVTLEGLDVDFLEIETFQDLRDAIEFLQRYCHYRDIFFNDSADGSEKEKARLQLAALFKIKKKAEAEQFEPPLWYSVALDSLTETQKINMLEIMQAVVEENPDRDPDVPSMREWGKSGNQIRQVVRQIRGLKMHSFFLALPNIDKDEGTGKMEAIPSLPGKLAREVPGYVDIVGFLESKDDNGKFQNSLYVRPFNKHVALKDRTRSLGAGMTNPTIPKIFTKWQEAKQARKENKKDS